MKKRLLFLLGLFLLLGYYESSAQQKITITPSMIVSESGNPNSHPEKLADEQNLVASTPSGLPTGYCSTPACPQPNNGWSTWFNDNAVLTFSSSTVITELYLFDGYGSPSFGIDYYNGSNWVTLSNVNLNLYRAWHSVSVPGGSITTTKLRFRKMDQTNSVWEIALYGTSGGCNGNLSIGNISTTPTGATVNWSGVTNANNYDLIWTLNGQTVGNAIDNNSPYSINGLTPNTTYEVCVTANCSGGTSQDCKTFSTTNTSNGITLDIFPNNVTHPTNSHVIGISRNAVKADGDATNGLFSSMLNDYKNITPTYGAGNGKKIYRLGGSHIDGNVCTTYGVNLGGYIFNQWTNQNGPYPYDDIDNFIQEAEDMNADMVIGINFGSGTPQLAKDLVNYLKNHPTKGNLLPKVAFFELGNEISGEWQKGHTSSCDGEQYAYNAVDFINKMREADPNIKIGVPMADTYSFGWAPFGYPNDICQSYPLPYCTNNPNNWQFNIDKTIEIIGDKIDYIIFHGYSPWPLFQPASGNCANASYSDVNEMGKRLLAAAPYGTNFIENNVRVQLNASKIAHGVTRDIKFANTEFFSHVDIGTSNTSTGAQLSHSISEAIFSADGILNALKYDYGSAINFSFYHCNSSSGGGFPCASDFSSNLLFDITSNGQSFSHKPSFNVHELLAENLGTQVIGDLITGNPQFNYTSCSDPNQMVTYDKIGLLSTKAADGTLYLLVINRGNTDQTVKIDPHMSYNSASIRSIYGSGYGDHNPTYTPSFSNISDLNAVNIKKLSINIIKIGSTPSSCVITMNTFTSSDGSTCDTYTLDITGNQSSGQIIIPITNLPGNGFNPNQTSATSGTLSWLSSTGLKWTIPSISQGQNYTATMTYCWAALASPTATYNQGTCNESITASSSSPLVSNNNNLQFAVAKNHRKVDINWLTTTDFKNEKFIIQRSADGATFQDLTELESITQNTAPQLYKSVDKQPLFGANFYRLKQVFEDGTFEYSNTQKVLFNIDLNEISVYPNPANTEIFVAIKQLAGRKGTLKIINTLGEVQHELDLEKTTTELVSFDLNGYVNGLYIIAIDVEGKRKITRKFVVAKK